MKVGYRFNLGVLWGMKVLLCYHNTLFEEVLVYCNTVLLWHQHPVNE